MKKAILTVACLALGLLVGSAWSVLSHDAPPADDGSQTAAGEVAEAAPVSGPAEDSTAEAAAVDTVSADTREPDTAESLTSEVEVVEAGAAHAAAHAAGVAADPPVQPSTAAAGNGTAVPEPAGTRPDRQEVIMAGEPGTGSDGPGAEQLTRIFSAMQARDAARVLSQLRNDEVEQILTRMPARQAAAVLSNMDPDRAAILSRGVLSGGGVR